MYITEIFQNIFYDKSCNKYVILQVGDLSYFK